jgi:hypothetical protein
MHFGEIGCFVSEHNLAKLVSFVFRETRNETSFAGNPSFGSLTKIFNSASAVQNFLLEQNLELGLHFINCTCYDQKG